MNFIKITAKAVFKIFNTAPAVFGKSHSGSHRYEKTNSWQIARSLGKIGYSVYTPSIHQRSEGKTSEHQMVFGKGLGSPAFLLVNSHNTRKSLELRAGYLTDGGDFIPLNYWLVKHRHSGGANHNVQLGVGQIKLAEGLIDAFMVSLNQPLGQFDLGKIIDKIISDENRSFGRNFSSKTCDKQVIIGELLSSLDGIETVGEAVATLTRKISSIFPKGYQKPIRDAKKEGQNAFLNELAIRSKQTHQTDSRYTRVHCLFGKLEDAFLLPSISANIHGLFLNHG